MMCRNNIDSNNNTVDTSDEQHSRRASSHLETGTRVHHGQSETASGSHTADGIDFEPIIARSASAVTHSEQKFN